MHKLFINGKTIRIDHPRGYVGSVIVHDANLVEDFIHSLKFSGQNGELQKANDAINDFLKFLKQGNSKIIVGNDALEISLYSNRFHRAAEGELVLGVAPPMPRLELEDMCERLATSLRNDYPSAAL